MEFRAALAVEGVIRTLRQFDWEPDVTGDDSGDRMIEPAEVRV